jgi:3-oxoacyl-[acyl-carrier protein] reductase
MFELTDKTALVTGATGGIGGGIARALHKQGATVAISGRQTDKLEKLAAELGSRVHVMPCDLANKAQVAKLIDETVAKVGGRLDIVVNNAGISERVGLEDLDEATLARTLDVTLKGTVLVSQAAYPHLKQYGGVIVNITSTSGMAGGTVSFRSEGAGPGGRSGPAYAAAKAGVIAFTRWLAKDAGRYGIRVNAVAPGPVETDMTRGYDYSVTTQPIARMGQPEDVAQAVVYLASPMANWVTGQVLVVDGGVVMD